MWSSLSSYADVTGLKAAASKLKGQLSELTSEVLADLEESESQAKDNVEQYRARKAAEQQQQQQHMQHGHDAATEDEQQHEQPAGTEHFQHQHQQPNGHGASASSSSSGHNGGGGGGDFFDAAAHALQAQLEDEFAPTHTLPLSDGTGLGQSGFPVAEMDDTQRAEQAAYEQHLREQRMLQEQHMAAQQQQQQLQLNGFGQAHEHAAFDHSQLQPHSFAPLDTMASPQYEGHSAAAPDSAHSFHEHTPVAHVHTLQQASHSPSQLHDHALEDHGSLAVEHHAPVESDSQSPLLDLAPHADEMDGVDLQQQQQAMFDHAQQQQQQQTHDQQQLAHLQSLLQQSEFDHAQQAQHAAARIQQLESERQERDDQLAQVQTQGQESRARLSAELESREQEYERLQSAYTQLMQRQQQASAAPAAAANVITPPSSAVDSESSLDVSALLDDSSVAADEKLSLLAEEIELLMARSRKWQALAQATETSDAPTAAAAAVPSSPAPASSSGSEDAAARIAALESQVEELQERLETVTDEKDTLTEILNELKAESNQATAPAAAAAAATSESDARWSAQLEESASQLRALAAEKELMSRDFEQSFQSHAAQVHHLESQLTHAHQQISAAQTTAAEQQQAMLEALQLQQGQAEEIQQLQQQIVRANQEIAALNDQHEADQTALQQLQQQQQQQQQELHQLSAAHDAALLAAASVPSSPSNRTLLPAFDISASNSVANTPAGTGAHLLPPCTPSPSLERQQELESLRAQLGELTKANEKLRHFRSQAVAWKTAAEASMHRLLARKEQIQLDLKQVKTERDTLRQQHGMTIPATGGDPSASSSSSSSTAAEASSLPFAALDPAKVAELQAHEHAAALALVQAQLDLARQQLGMHLDHIEVLQARIRELEKQGQEAGHAQASSHSPLSAEESARIEHEYLQVTDALRGKLQTAEQALEAQRSQLEAAAAQEQQLQSLQQQHHDLQSNYNGLLEAYESVCNRGRQDAATAVELQAQLDALRSKSEEDLSALQLQLDAARSGSSDDVASVQAEWSSRLQSTEDRFNFELTQQREERAKAETSWLEMLTTKQSEWDMEVEQERESWKLTEQQWASQQQAAAEQNAQQINDLQAELQSSTQQVESLQQQLQAAAAAAPAPAPEASVDASSAAHIADLDSQIAALTAKAAQHTDFTKQMVAQQNARYEQLLTSFTNLQARCRDGLEGEEGNLAQIAELRAALAAQQKAAAEVQGDMQTQLDAARAESRKAAAGSGELGIMTMRWREAMSEADSLRNKIRNLQENRGESSQLGDAPVASADMQDELQSLRHQIKNLQLDAASMESLQSDYSALQRNFDMSASMLTEARTTIEELRRALDDAQRGEHAAQSELASLRNASADSLVQASSVADSPSSRVVADLQSALSRKSDQLVEMSQYTSSLESEILTLRKTFESKLRNFNALADEHLVDRRLVVKMLVTYFERPNKDEVLALMGRVLQFSAEDNARIQKGRQGYMGMLGSFLRSPAGEDSAPFHSEADANLADNFFNFLMQETEKEAAAAAAAAAGGPKPATTAPAPLTAGGAARAALEQQRQTASFSRESEFESRPTRSIADQQQHRMMPPPSLPQQQQTLPPPQQQPPQPQAQAPPQWSSSPALAPSPLPPPPLAGGAGAPLAPPSFAPLALPPFSAPFPPSASGAPAGFVALPPLPFAGPSHAMAPFPGAADGSVAPPGFLMPPQPLGPLPPMPVNGFQLPPPLHAPR